MIEKNGTWRRKLLEIRIKLRFCREYWWHILQITKSIKCHWNSLSDEFSQISGTWTYLMNRIWSLNLCQNLFKMANNKNLWKAWEVQIWTHTRLLGKRKILHFKSTFTSGVGGEEERLLSLKCRGRGGKKERAKIFNWWCHMTEWTWVTNIFKFQLSKWF